MRFWGKKATSELRPPAPPPKPSFEIRVEAELTRGTCGWWSNAVAYPKDGRTGLYVRLTSGPYRAEAVEMKSGLYRLAGHRFVRSGEPDVDYAEFHSLTSAIRRFEEYVTDDLRSFVRPTLESKP